MLKNLLGTTLKPLTQLTVHVDKRVLIAIGALALAITVVAAVLVLT